MDFETLLYYLNIIMPIATFSLLFYFFAKIEKLMETILELQKKNQQTPD